MKTKHVVAAIIEKDDRILLARRAPGEHSEGLWEFPGGKQEKGESLKQSLEREIMEEFSVEIEAKEIFCTTDTVVDDFRLILYALKAKYINGKFVPTVHDKIVWIKKEDILDYTFPTPDIPIAQKIYRRHISRDNKS